MKSISDGIMKHIPQKSIKDYVFDDKEVVNDYSYEYAYERFKSDLLLKHNDFVLQDKRYHHA